MKLQYRLEWFELIGMNLKHQWLGFIWRVECVVQRGGLYCSFDSRSKNGPSSILAKILVVVLFVCCSSEQMCRELLRQGHTASCMYSFLYNWVNTVWVFHVPYSFPHQQDFAQIPIKRKKIWNYVQVIVKEIEMREIWCHVVTPNFAYWARAILISIW